MRNRLAEILSAAILISVSAFSNAQTTALLEYSAEYKASANGLAASARRSLNRIAENRYRLSNALEASLAGQSLAKLEQASEFSVTEDRILPHNYSYQLSGISRSSHAIFFNWDAGIALSTEDDESWQLPLQDSVMDQLSYQVAIRKALLNNAARETTFSFDIVDGDDIDSHEYRLVGEELLTTPLGELTTVKLERVRAADDERVTEIWLAVDWNYLLTRIEQLNSSGLRIVLELKSATIDGKEVSANL